jgi:Fe-S oxidoreductase
LLPDGKAFLLVEFGGDSKADSDRQAMECMAKLKLRPGAPSMKLYDNPQEESKLWEVRESGLGSTAFVPGLPDMWPGWEDSAVPPENIGDYLRELRKLFDKFGYKPSVYGHFGQGCVHCRIDFDLYTAEGVNRWRSFLDEAAGLVVRHGGSLSGEHGDGQARAELLPKMFGEELVQAFREFKTIWDPQWKMNPGKIVDPHPITANLRLGPNYEPPQVKTYFQYPDDKHSFARGALRCVGVGKCRNHNSDQTMCPSYMVTREERHSTRGRARLLWEMLNGELKHEGWRSEAVREALDLCLACKGCKGDCPVNVDMATYKAEFLSHYYQGRLRPRHAYAMGWIYWWAQAASLIPNLINLAGRAPIVGGAIKWLGGISQKRKIPEFATQTFRDWFQARPVKNATAPPAILWPDTFTNFFHPQIGKAAVKVLEAAGFQVRIPHVMLCCGRPLYDFGMLASAKQLLEQTMMALAKDIAAGVPIVGLEPSCVSVFRDELRNWFPEDPQAIRLREQTFLLSEFLEKYAPHFAWPKLQRKALVHLHCHHKSVLGSDAEKKVLEKLGLDFEILDSGCCGMAGSFGFESDHYDVSIACGERALLPAVRKASADTLLVTDGFSCHEQIQQCAGRRALHLAEVMRMALDQQVESSSTTATVAAAHRQSIQWNRREKIILAGGAIVAAWTAWRFFGPKHDSEN